MSQFTDAFVGAITAQFDPQAKATVEFMGESTVQMKQDNQRGQLRLLGEATNKYLEIQEKADTLPACVVEAYERILQTITS